MRWWCGAGGASGRRWTLALAAGAVGPPHGPQRSHRCQQAPHFCLVEIVNVAVEIFGSQEGQIAQLAVSYCLAAFHEEIGPVAQPMLSQPRSHFFIDVVLVGC